MTSRFVKKSQGSYGEKMTIVFVYEAKGQQWAAYIHVYL